MITTAATAQNLADRNWFFGNPAKGIQFDRPNYQPFLVNPGVTFGMGGGAVATDANTGNLLFYTDGNNVYDASNALMLNSGLGGDTNLNQAAAICPVPGKPNQYYIFTIASGVLQQDTVDMSRIGNTPIPSTIPLGDVISNTPSPTGLINRSGAVIIIQDADSVNSWLITQPTNVSNTYTVTHITNSTFASVDVPITSNILSATNFAYQKSTGKLAVTPGEIGKNVELFDFNNQTGELTVANPVLGNPVIGSGKVNTTIYDVEWSLSGKYLYVSRNEASQSDVVQIDLTASPITSPVSLPLSSNLLRSYGLQMGLDSAIYHLYETTTNQFFLGKIEDTDSAVAKVIYTKQAFPGNFNAKQFPSFSPPAKTTYAISFVPVGDCLNSPITFFPTVTPAADSVVWSFGDVSPPLTSWSPVHTYTANPTKAVMAKAFLNGKIVANASLPLSLKDFKLQLTLKSDTTACSCELKYPKANPPPFPPPFPSTSNTCTLFSIVAQANGGSNPKYQWYGPSGLLSTKTSLTLDVVDSAGYYYIKATEPSSGCSVTAGQNVKEYHVQDQRANIWHFGNTAGINFNPLFYTPPKNRPAVPITSPINSTEGVAVICDQNGQIVFSTDGTQVYDRAGTPLIASIPAPPVNPSSTQSALIIPVAGDQTLFYIFTTESAESNTNKLSYMLFDLKLGTLGGIVNGTSNTLFTRSTERLTGNANWVIAHDYGNNSFRAYKISTAGISAPVITDIGANHSVTTIQNAEGYMKLGPKNRLAVALSDGSSNAIELFDFVDSTGTLKNYRRIDLTGTSPSDQVYGIEFSPGGSKLYSTVKNSAGSVIYEYAIDSLGMPTLLQKSAVIPGELGAIQTGPDGQTYIAVNGSGSLLSFQPNENLLQKTDFTSLQPFALNGPSTSTSTSTLGLPNFIQNLGAPLQSPSMNVPPRSCPNIPVSFSATPSDQYRDNFNWSVLKPDGTLETSSTKDNFQHTFETQGTYKVTLDITSTCSFPNNLVKRFTQDLIINPAPAKPFLPPPDNNLLCIATKLLEATPTPANLTFVWTTKQTSNRITISKPGNYGVTITNSFGCTSTGSIDIYDNRPVVDLGPDFPMCTNETRTLNAGNPAAGISYRWTIDDAAVSNNQLLDVRTTDLPVVHRYAVTVTDASNTCTASDTVLVTLNAVPTFTSTQTLIPACGANGAVRIDITSVGNHTVDFNGITKTNIPQGAITPDYTLPAGSYPIVITNLAGCKMNDIVGLSNSTFSISNFMVITCTDVPVTITPSGTPTAPVNYKITNRDTGLLEVPLTQSPSASFSTSALPVGKYIIEVTDFNPTPCKASANIDINLGTKVDFSIRQECNIITASPTNPANPPNTNIYNWSGAGITPISGNQLTIPPNTSGTIIVEATDNSGNGLCKATQSIPVNITDNTIQPDFTQTDACVSPVELEATPVGSYIYTWGGTKSGGGQKLIVTQSGNYSLLVRSNVSGCNLGTSVSHDVIVIDPVTLSLSSSLPCAGQTFTITSTTTPATAVISSIQWYRDNKIISDSVRNTLQATLAGTYKISALNKTCLITAQLPVNVLPLDQDSLKGAYYVCDDPDNTDSNTNQVTLNPGNQFDRYVWYKDGKDLNTNTPTLLVTELGNYSANLTNAFGCQDEAETKVLRDCRPRITGPNAFRPGGLNSEFFLYTFFISDEDFKIFIFNRWGEMIYQSNDKGFRWNGSFNGVGAPVPPGMYTWVVKYKSSYRPKGIEEQHGGVMLLR